MKTSIGRCVALAALAFAACGEDGSTTDARPAAGGSLAEFQEEYDAVTVALGDCMSDQGFAPAPLDSSMALTFDLAEGTDQASFDRALAECGARHPYPGPPTLDRSQLDALHARLVDRAGCLEAHGHPPIERPSADGFADAMSAFLADGTGEPWEPLDAASLPADVDVADLQAACPSPRLGDLDDG